MQLNDSIPMKDKLLETISELRKNGVDLSETPALFQWTYNEEPKIFIQLLIRELDGVPDKETLH
jgi:hypothetical protein